MPRSLCSTQAASGFGLSFSASTPRRHDPSAQHRHPVERRAWRVGVDEGVEALSVGRLDIDEIEGRRLRRAAPPELVAQSAVDLEHGDEQREAEAQRQHDVGVSAPGR